MNSLNETTETGLSSPTVSHIADSLEQRIKQGVYQSGQRLPTERSLAEEFKVSRITIRSAVKEIERRELVVCSAGCRPLVRGSRSTLHRAVPAAARRSLALWVWPSPTWLGSVMIVNGIRQTLDHDDFRLILESAIGETFEERLSSEDRFLRRIGNDRDVEGVILWYLGDDINRPALEALRSANVPMVFLDRLPPDGFDADYVGVDNVRAADQAVKHLLSLGHRSIAHITNMDTASTITERYSGYCKALERANIPVRPEMVMRDSLTGDRAESTIALVEALLALPDLPTAIFAVNDEVAYRTIAAVKALGRRVPDDMAVVGFDGIEHWRPEPPFLTTMCQPFEQMGAKAVDLLLERIALGSAGSNKHVLLEAPLRTGGSTHRKEAIPEHAAIQSS